MLAALRYLVILTNLIITPAIADIYGQFSVKELTVYAEDKPKPDADRAVVNVHVAAKVWTLLGHPVYMCTAWWELLSTTIDGKRYVANTQSDLTPPKEVLNKIRLWDSQFELPIKTAATPSAYLRCDAGEFWAPNRKKPSFNVPGSPAWKDLFYRSSATTGFSQKLSASAAQAVMKDQLASFNVLSGQFSHLGVIKLKADFGAVYGWLAEADQKDIETVQQSVDKDLSSAPTDFDSLFETVEKTKLIKAQQKTQAKKQRTAQNYQRKYASHQKSLMNKPCWQGTNEPQTESLQAYIEEQGKRMTGCLQARNLKPYRNTNPDIAEIGLYGYIDKTHQDILNPRWIILPQFKEAREFKNGFAVVASPDQKRRYGVIDIMGTYIVDTEWDYIDHVPGGLNLERDINYKSRILQEASCNRGGKDKVTKTWFGGVMDYKGNWRSQPQRRSKQYTANSIKKLCILTRQKI